MKLSATIGALAALATCVHAVRIPFKQTSRDTRKRSGITKVSVHKPAKALSNVKVLASTGGDNDGIEISTVHDLIYMANITLGGQDYIVQLDTGSSDLWIKGASSPLPNTDQTSTTLNLTYGIGWAFGHLSYAQTQFAGVNISKQAFLDVSDANNPALGYGAEGILGLGFTSLSTIDALVNGTGASIGRSLLYNTFLDNPSEPNFITFSLQRGTDANDRDEAEGSFTIGEFEDGLESVNDSVKLPTWPVSFPKRWNVLLEALFVGNNTYPVSTTVSGAPSNRAVALLDSGTSYTYVPKEVCDAIYGNIEGASFDADLGQWVVPCNQEIDMALQFGGLVYPIHPLDVTPTSLTDDTKCVGSFVPSTVSVGAGEFDWLVGDSTLRSMYSMYDFGDFNSAGYMGDPYVKLLSIVDADAASADFAKARGTKARSGITYNASNSPTSASTTVTLSSDVADVIDKIGKYLPIMAAVVGLNAVVLLVLAVVGICFLCKRKGSRGGISRFSRKRATPGRMSPMPMGPPSHPDAFTPPSGHDYEPVSMAISEDTVLNPPSPGYKKYDFSRPKSDLSSMDRPYSMAAPGARPYSLASPSARPYSLATNMSPAELNPNSNPFINSRSAASGSPLAGSPSGLSPGAHSPTSLGPAPSMSPLSSAPMVAPPEPIMSSERPPSVRSVRSARALHPSRMSRGSMDRSASQDTLESAPPLPNMPNPSMQNLLRPSAHLRNQSVSSANSEFVAPVPAFHGYDSGARPKSFA